MSAFVAVERAIERLKRFEQSVRNADDKVSKAITNQDKDGMRGGTAAKEACQAEAQALREDLKRARTLIEAALS